MNKYFLFELMGKNLHIRKKDTFLILTFFLRLYFYNITFYYLLNELFYKITEF